MTAIAACVKDGTIYMGGDSAGVAGYGLVIRKDKKVFKNGEFLIGCTTSFRMIQILQYDFTPPKPVEGEADDKHKFMVTRFIPAVREAFKRSGFCKDAINDGGVFIVGWRGELFVVESDYQVGQLVVPFASCGCGEGYILGSMAALHESAKEMSGSEYVKKSLEIAEKWSAGVRGPFEIISSDGSDK